MHYTPDIFDLEAALKHLHDPETLRTNPLATLDVVHQRVAPEQRLAGARTPPLPWIYGYELAIMLRALVDSLDDRDEELGAGEGRKTASRPRLYARILKLRFSQGLSWNEVAAEVGRVAGHIQNKLKRPALQMLLGELLRARAPAATPAPPEDARPITNLPPQAEFIGRRSELEQVLGKLRRRRLPISEICGVGGVGKSELAKRVGWLALSSERLFDAVVWLSAQESYFSLTRFQTVSASNVVRSLGDLLDITAWLLGSNHAPLELGDKQRQVLAALASGRYPRGVLLIVDNYESLDPSEQERIATFLFDELPYPSQALITSRHEEHRAMLQSHVLPTQVRLGRMSVEDTLACLRHFMKLQQPPMVMSATLMEQICIAADGIPLALLWLLGQMRYSSLPPAQMLDDLRGEQASSSPLLSYIFDHSYAMLNAHPHALHVLHALIAFVHTASLAALAHVADLAPEETSNALELLLQLSLTCCEEERYSTLALTRAYTRSKMTHDERQQAMLRACAYYIAHERGDLLARPNLLALIEWAAAAGQHQAIINLFDTLTTSHLIGSPTQVQDCDSYGVAVVNACLYLGLEERADWYTLYAVCWPQVARRRFAETQAQIESLLARAQRNHWYGNQALACSTLGLLYYDQSDPEDDDAETRTWSSPYSLATHYLEVAAGLWEQLERRDWLAIVLGRLAAICRSSNDYTGALAYYTRTEALYDELDDAAGKALTMRRRAHTMLQLYRTQQSGSPRQIATLLEGALTCYAQLGDRRGSALSHLYYAELLLMLGEHSRASEQTERAQADFTYIHDAYGAQRAAVLAQQIQTT